MRWLRSRKSFVPISEVHWGYKPSERAYLARLQFERPRERERQRRERREREDVSKTGERGRGRAGREKSRSPRYRSDIRRIPRAPFLSADRSQPRLRPFVITWGSAVVKGATATGCLGLGRPHFDRPLTRSALGRRTCRDALTDAIVR